MRLPRTAPAVLAMTLTFIVFGLWFLVEYSGLILLALIDKHTLRISKSK